MPSYVKVVSDLEYNTLPSPASRARLAAAVSGTSSESAAETNKETSLEKMTHNEVGAPSATTDNEVSTNDANDTKLPSTNTTITSKNTAASNNSNPMTTTADTTVNNIKNSNYSQAAINWADKMKQHKSTTTNTVVAANNTTFTNDTVSDELAAQLTAQSTTQQTPIGNAVNDEPTQQQQIGTTANKPAQHPPTTDWYHRHNNSRHSQIISNTATINGTANNGLAPPPKLPQTVQQPAPNNNNTAIGLEAPPQQPVQPQQKQQQQNGKVQKTNKKSKCNKSIAEQAMAALNDDDHSSSSTNSSSDSSSRDEDENEAVLLNEAAGVLNGVNKDNGEGNNSSSSDNSIITQPPSTDEAAGLKNNVNGRLSSKGAAAVQKQSAVDKNGVQEMDVDIEQLSSVYNNKDSNSDGAMEVEKGDNAMEVDKNSAMEVINIDDDDEEDNTNNSTNNSSNNNNNTNRYNSSNITTEQANAIDQAFSGIKSYNQSDARGLDNYRKMLEENGIINNKSNNSSTTASSNNKSINSSNKSSTSGSTTTKTLFNIGPLTNEYKKNMVLPESYTQLLMVILKELAVTLADLEQKNGNSSSTTTTYTNILTVNHIMSIAQLVPRQLNELSDCYLPPSIIDKYGRHIVACVVKFVDKEKLNLNESTTKKLGSGLGGNEKPSSVQEMDRDVARLSTSVDKNDNHELLMLQQQHAAGGQVGTNGQINSTAMWAQKYGANHQPPPPPPPAAVAAAIELRQQTQQKQQQQQQQQQQQHQSNNSTATATTTTNNNSSAPLPQIERFSEYRIDNATTISELESIRNRLLTLVERTEDRLTEKRLVDAMSQYGEENLESLSTEELMRRLTKVVDKTTAMDEDDAAAAAGDGDKSNGKRNGDELTNKNNKRQCTTTAVTTCPLCFDTTTSSTTTGTCQVCEDTNICNQCYAPCSCCKRPTCADCLMVCDGCGKVYHCADCMIFGDGKCKTCRSKKTAAPPRAAPQPPAPSYVPRYVNGAYVGLQYQQQQPSQVPTAVRKTSMSAMGQMNARLGQPQSQKRYGDRYSAANVKARHNQDGSVRPATAPKQSPGGRFAQPKGRARKDCDWDARRGVWVPKVQQLKAVRKTTKVRPSFTGHQDIAAKAKQLAAAQQSGRLPNPPPPHKDTVANLAKTVVAAKPPPPPPQQHSFHRFIISEEGTIGLNFTLETKTNKVRVTTVHPNSMALKHDVQVGDEILAPSSYTASDTTNVYKLFLDGASNRPLLFEVSRPCTDSTLVKLGGSAASMGKVLHRFIITREGSLGMTCVKDSLISSHEGEATTRISEVAPNSLSDIHGVQVDDIICKPGSNGAEMADFKSFINFAKSGARPLTIEVLRDAGGSRRPAPSSLSANANPYVLSFPGDKQKEPEKKAQSQKDKQTQKDNKTQQSPTDGIIVPDLAPRKLPNGFERPSTHKEVNVEEEKKSSSNDEAEKVIAIDSDSDEEEETAWECDFCQARFDTYELTAEHEKTCKSRDSSATADNNQNKPVDALPTSKPSASQSSTKSKSSPKGTNGKEVIVDSGGIKCGDVGYKFKKWFGKGYDAWYDGEVVELVDINGVLHRRCRYVDGDIEDYIITQMKKHCKPR